MDIRKKLNSGMVKEFIRYLLVGGSAFLLDTGILWFTQTYIFFRLGDGSIYAATAAGFAAGLVYNNLLSIFFVFKANEKPVMGKGIFIVFSIIGVIGFGLTELGMHIGVSVLEIHFLPVKVVVAGLVLIWNYAGRKFFLNRR